MLLLPFFYKLISWKWIVRNNKLGWKMCLIGTDNWTKLHQSWNEHCSLWQDLLSWNWYDSGQYIKIPSVELTELTVCRYGKPHIATMLLVYYPGGNKCLKNCVYKSDVVSKVTSQQNALIKAGITVHWYLLWKILSYSHKSN